MLPFGPDINQIRLNNQAEIIEVPVGEALTVGLTATEGQINQQNSGNVAQQAISQVALYLNAPPWQEGATALPLTALDGDFNSTTEQASITLDTNGWSQQRHTIYLRAQDDDGNWGPVYAQFVDIGAPNVAPVAEFSVSCTDGNCSFDASSSSDSDGEIQSYQWDFGDNNQAAGQSVQHQFAASGDFEVTLTVTDDRGTANTQVQTVSVTLANQAPQAQISISCEHLACSLDASASSDSDGSIASYQWNLGDGSTATGETVQHSYTADGSYTVELVVTDDLGLEAQASQSVTVAAAQPEPPQKKSSGGSSHWMLLVLLATAGLLRRSRTLSQ